jgi:ketosteroid isomerase-like protein
MRPMHSSQSAGSSSSSVRPNVALVLRGIERWNAGDWEGALEDLDPDVEWHTSGDIPGFDPVYRGHDGVRRFWKAWTETWEAIRIDVEQVVDRGEDVFLIARFHARGRDGVEVDQPVGFRFTSDADSDRLTRFESYWNRDEMPLDVRTSDGGHGSS